MDKIDTQEDEQRVCSYAQFVHSIDSKPPKSAHLKMYDRPIRCVWHSASRLVPMALLPFNSLLHLERGSIFSGYADLYPINPSSNS
jgi:hypothetical protein